MSRLRLTLGGALAALVLTGALGFVGVRSAHADPEVGTNANCVGGFAATFNDPGNEAKSHGRGGQLVAAVAQTGDLAEQASTNCGDPHPADGAAGGAALPVAIVR